jgi:hypothetical protein
MLLVESDYSNKEQIDLKKTLSNIYAFGKINFTCGADLGIRYILNASIQLVLRYQV